MNSMSIMVNNYGQNKSIFRLMEITWNLEPEPFKGPFLNF